jgi:hypothetical protein
MFVYEELEFTEQDIKDEINCTEQLIENEKRLWNNYNDNDLIMKMLIAYKEYWEKRLKFQVLLIETKRVWSKIPGNALEDFYNAINGSDKYNKIEKELAKQILLN